jgi:hypothetical protein
VDDLPVKIAVRVGVLGGARQDRHGQV